MKQLSLADLGYIKIFLKNFKKTNDIYNVNRSIELIENIVNRETKKSKVLK